MWTVLFLWEIEDRRRMVLRHFTTALVLAVLFGCNLCYATPIAYQTNMLIMAEGSYAFKDYVRTGVPLVLIMVTMLSLALVVTYGL